MSDYIEIKPEEFTKNTFKAIGKEWMLITGKNEDKVNTMTASWGGFGVIWNKNVSFIFIRPERYTKEFIDNSERFSLTFFKDTYKEDLRYLGSVSGREENKIANTNLTIDYLNNVPYFKEADSVIICKKLYAQELKSECFVENKLDEKNYPNNDYHTMYIGEIEKIITKK